VLSGASKCEYSGIDYWVAVAVQVVSSDGLQALTRPVLATIINLFSFALDTSVRSILRVKLGTPGAAP